MLDVYSQLRISSFHSCFLSLSREFCKSNFSPKKIGYLFWVSFPAYKEPRRFKNNLLWPMVYLHSLPHGLHLPDLCRCCCKLVVLLSNENTSQWALQSTHDQTACGQTGKRDNQRIAHQFLLQQHILADCPLIPATDNFPHDDSKWSFPPWSLISSFLLPAVEALQSRKGWTLWSWHQWGWGSSGWRTSREDGWRRNRRRRVKACMPLLCILFPLLLRSCLAFSRLSLVLKSVVLASPLAKGYPSLKCRSCQWTPSFSMYWYSLQYE